MNKSIFKKNNILKIFNYSLINLPTPININIWWNFGSLLGLCLMIQILTGLFLSMHYCANVNLAFQSLIHIIQNVNYGWEYRLMHMNGASFFFLCMYMHIGRGIYYSSYKFKKTWFMGILIFLTTMGTAFMGYVLPWGQMSFWGATVITNLISTIPSIGQMIVEWIWGGFSVSNPTLNRFFSLHFILPFLILMMVIFHLIFIHETSSNNPLGSNSKLYMINFHNYFTLKDFVGFIMLVFLLKFMNLQFPFLLNDPENFILANSLITPIHIQPEWYFLFAYTILRSIPNKLGGVISLLFSILILSLMPFLMNNKFFTMKFFFLNQILFWCYFNNVILLTWLGSQPVENPFILISQILTVTYFSFYFINALIFWMMYKIIF
uniref:Cytochrome b n=1 Tax=Diadegma semiclausum TaxID=208481 RepID=C4N029_DIASM|nr:cytochrome b [Diadegma semiclausum]ACF35067.1 cytochrome b [Diadegma semiclausum]